ncbi:transposase [Trichodesmium erythraeum]|uniref:transposase n=1 Tax=Trichodesmium erythraeum TaxID=1206 RepID=UPI0002D4F027|nr:transposase [Trichodesmium erythraeum GBRTRLIN201]
MDDASLKPRGSLTFWLSQEVIEQWLNQNKTGLRGASNTYSNVPRQANGHPCYFV